MAAENPDHKPEDYLPWHRDLKRDPSIIFGQIGHGKHNLLGFLIEKSLQGRTSAPIEPLTQLETGLARTELGMSEQEAEKLSRFSGKQWLNAMGVEYPKEWE
jgi:hypothetical protein